MKSEYIGYSPAETSTINTLNSQNYINISGEDSIISLLNNFLNLNFGVIKKADKSRCANGIDMRTVNLGPIALFNSFELTTGSGKHLEVISHAHISSLLYKLSTSAEDSNDLSDVFDRDHGRRRDEMTNKKN